MVFSQIQRSWKYLLVACVYAILIIIIIILSMRKNSFKMSIQTPAKEPLLSPMKHEMEPSCPNVLDNMVVGRWVQDKPNQTEMAAVAEFHRIIQAVHGIPETLQREDEKCGNVNMVGTGKRGVIPFRALCNPNGSTPCCFENKCVLKDIENCRCQDCYDMRQKLHAEVSTWIPANQTCKTRLRNIKNWKSTQIKETLQHIDSLHGQLNSVVVMGVGIHDNFNLAVVENKILNPLLLNLAKSPWPKLIWASPHAPGLLKSPTYNKQQTEHVVQYNLRVNSIMRSRGIPVLDFFEMTKSVFSLDGTHYGLGVNEVKAQILLNYILEMRTKALSSGFNLCCFAV